MEQFSEAFARGVFGRSRSDEASEARDSDCGQIQEKGAPQCPRFCWTMTT